MKNLLIFLVLLIMAAACNPVTGPVADCPPADTIFVDRTCYTCIDAYFAKQQYRIDSVAAAKRKELLSERDHNTFLFDSLKAAAIAEAKDYRVKSIYQVDTMRRHFLTWMDSIKAFR